MAEGGKGLCLNLGCGDDIRKDFINIDSHMPDNAKNFVQMDLSKFPWDGNCPFLQKDSQIDFILARDFIEHIADKIGLMNEIWRVLKPGGLVHIEVPTTDGTGAWQDPTHVSFWNARSFLYYEDGNPYRERFAKSYGIVARFKILRHRHEKTIDGIKLYISLEAVK